MNSIHFDAKCLQTTNYYIPRHFGNNFCHVVLSSFALSESVALSALWTKTQIRYCNIKIYNIYVVYVFNLICDNYGRNCNVYFYFICQNIYYTN